MLQSSISKSQAKKTLQYFFPYDILLIVYKTYKVTMLELTVNTLWSMSANMELCCMSDRCPMCMCMCAHTPIQRTST